MPWTAADAHDHKKGLTSAQATRWAKIANAALAACLHQGGSDATCAPQAIRQANGTVGRKTAAVVTPPAPDASGDDAPLYTEICKQAAPLRYTLGIVYEPMAVDAQGDFATAETIREAAWGFMQKLQMEATLTKRTLPILTALLDAARKRQPVKVDITTLQTELLKAKPLLGDQHASWDAGTGTIVECYTMPCEATVGRSLVSEGTWLLGVVWSPEYFSKILAGERTGYSLGGWSRRRYVEEM